MRTEAGMGVYLKKNNLLLGFSFTWLPEDKKTSEQKGVWVPCHTLSYPVSLAPDTWERAVFVGGMSDSIRELEWLPVWVLGTSGGAVW